MGADFSATLLINLNNLIMIFIATGADASANNLGKISIKSVSEIAADTLTKLNFFGKTWTDDQKIALDDFLVAFNAASWNSKVKVMSIPILLPTQNKVLSTTIAATGSKFRKNIVDWNNDLTPVSSFILDGYGYVGVSQNGIVLQNNLVDGTIYNNVNLGIKTTSFGITNKAMHYGVYYKSSSKFRAGSASYTEVLISSSTTSDFGTAYNSISVSVNNAKLPKKQLLIMNGDVTIATSKSYVNNALVSTTITNTAPSTVHSAAGIISGGSTSNVADDSTCCFMTFGNYMTDAELSEYGTLINTLMASLIV